MKTHHTELIFIPMRMTNLAINEEVGFFKIAEHKISFISLSDTLLR